MTARGEHRVYGVRHHGPGSARALLAALDAWSPDALLVEGPPEADPLVGLVADPDLVPPVALLVYAKEAPGRAVFYPFTDFSPEWQALRWAAARGVPARFMDLPAAEQLAADPPEDGDARAGGPAQRRLGLGRRERRSDAGARPHPFAQVALALGDDDPERWWEELVERRRDASEVFEAIAALMAELRQARAIDGGDAPDEAAREARREAHMRRAVRAAIASGYQRVAVVCGAWHAPALADLRGATADAQRLRGLSHAKVAATWIPWTAPRLAARSGYGAGVASPGWYAHLWSHPEDAAARWVASAARLLRDAQGPARAQAPWPRDARGGRPSPAADLDTSSAGVIDAIRLADALAALRGRSSPGLAELGEAVRATLCAGDDAPMALVRDALEVGSAVGRVPAATPTVPLAADLARERRRLRLVAHAEPEVLEVDLRSPLGRDRSALLHRLAALGLGWGRPLEVGAARGTFRERWELAWRPEHEVELIAASTWGNTVAAAATARVLAEADAAPTLVALAALLDTALLAGLDDALDGLCAALEAAAASAVDVDHLLGAVPPLARVARYGDVRGTPAERVGPVLRGLFARALLALPGACASLDDAAALARAEALAKFHAVVPLVAEAEAGTATGAATGAGAAAGAEAGAEAATATGAEAEWRAVLARLADDGAIHGLVRGLAARLLLEVGALAGAELEGLARRSLSRALPPRDAAAWLEGLLRGSALGVLHQDGLWTALDAWLVGLDAEAFEAQLPLLRRAFAAFTPAERRRMGERLGQHGARSAHPAAPELDPARAAAVLPILRTLLGVPHG